MENFSFTKRFIFPCLAIFSQTMVIWAILAYITIYWSDLGFSHFQVGILISMFPLTSLILMIPFGIVVDRISPKKMVIASHILSAISITGLLYAQQFTSTLFWIGIWGCANALFNNALPALFYKTMGDKYRGFKLGIYNASILSGYGLGPLVAGFILSSYTMSSVFIFSIIGFIPLTLLSMVLADVPGSHVKLEDYRADFKNKSVLIFVMLVFAFSLHAGAEQTNFSLYLSKDIGLNKGQIGWMFFIHANVMALLSIGNGIINDRIDARGKGQSILFYIGTFISGLTNILLIFATNFGSVLAMRLSHAVGDSLTMVTRSMIISNMFKSSRIGGTLGIITTTVTLGTLIGSLLCGAVSGYVTGFVIVGLIAILAVPIAILIKPEF